MMDYSKTKMTKTCRLSASGRSTRRAATVCWRVWPFSAWSSCSSRTASMTGSTVAICSAWGPPTATVPTRRHRRHLWWTWWRHHPQPPPRCNHRRNPARRCCCRWNPIRPRVKPKWTRRPASRRISRSRRLMMLGAGKDGGWWRLIVFFDSMVSWTDGKFR